MSESEAPVPVPVFAPHEKVCGNCKLWRAHSVDAAKGWVGQCRMQESRGLFPPSAPICDKYAPRGEVSAAASVAVEEPRARRLKPIGPEVRRAGAPAAVITEVPMSTRGTEEVDLQIGANVTRNELMDLFLESSGLAEVALAPKWEGAVIQILPKDATLQGKDVPVDQLFHKVVMIRNNLRTLEQKINAHTAMSDVQKVELQQAITRTYLSLGSLNVLFRDVEPSGRDDVRKIFIEALGAAAAELAPKWDGGRVQVVPKEGQGREWPMDALVTRVVGIRDRLRILERRIGAHPKLADSEKNEWAAYVTRCYGSLTTFNALFRDKADQFVGQKGED
jgi:hypothetical protein